MNNIKVNPHKYVKVNDKQYVYIANNSIAYAVKCQITKLIQEKLLKVYLLLSQEEKERLDLVLPSK